MGDRGLGDVEVDEVEEDKEEEEELEEEALGSTLTLEKVAAAKQFIENHYRAQTKNIRDRKERFAFAALRSLSLFNSHFLDSDHFLMLLPEFCVRIGGIPSSSFFGIGLVLILGDPAVLS